MTIRISLLLWLATASTAPRLALAQDAPHSELSPQVKRDLERAIRIMADLSAAYARLRSYSGRFEVKGRASAQSGLIQWQRPNRLSMSTEGRDRDGAYTRRAVSDGRFFYITEPGGSGNFEKRPLPEGPGAIGEMIGALIGMEIARMIGEPDRFKGLGRISSAWRIEQSLPPLRALAPQPPRRYGIRITQGKSSAIHTTHASGFKETLRYGPDKLLREVASEYPAPQYLREYEKHWEVRANPTLPASLFEWKPAPGARQLSAKEIEALRSR